jgi:hypothetical protein
MCQAGVSLAETFIMEGSKSTSLRILETWPKKAMVLLTSPSALWTKWLPLPNEQAHFHSSVQKAKSWKAIPLASIAMRGVMQVYVAL